MAVASYKVLWRVPPPALHLSPSLLLGSKLCGVVDMSQQYKSSPQKTTHHVVAVGVFFAGLLHGGWLVDLTASTSVVGAEATYRV